MAENIYELSNGAHTIRRVTIYQNSEMLDRANIRWISAESPAANPNGYGKAGWYVFFGDKMNNYRPPLDVLASPTNQGRAAASLAHEWGHYYYGLRDEYACTSNCSSRFSSPQLGDIPPLYSLMTGSARAWTSGQVDYKWVNFSVAKNHDPIGQTAQYRVYGASGWETLARPNSQDPRDGERVALPARLYYPELARVAPAAHQDPSLEMPATAAEARANLTIVWVEPGARIRQATSPYLGFITSILGDKLTAPQPALLVAHLMDSAPIAKAGVKATTQAADGKINDFSLKDDGLAPDDMANDGYYSGYMPYNQNGQYQITVTFDNVQGTAESTVIGLSRDPGPNGEEPDTQPIPIADNFLVVVTKTIIIQNVKTDDYGNTPDQSTILPLDNTDMPGKIDAVGDVDMFKTTTTFTGKLAVRVSDFALGMNPRLRMFQADGTTLLVDADLSTHAHANGYLFLTLPVTANQTLYLAVSHRDPTATTGLYNLSAGEFTANEQPRSSAVYLPIIVK